MGKTKLLQTNFTSGELSPDMLGRVDTTRYQNGAGSITNMLVRPQGGVWYRQGSKAITEVKYSSKKTIIYDFEFSDIQTYVLEIGDYYVRIYYDGGFVETTPGSGIPLEVVTPYSEDQLADLKFCQSADVLYITHQTFMPRKLMRLGANSWTIESIVPLDGPYIGADKLPDATLTISHLSSLSTATASAPLFTVPTTKSIVGFGYTGLQLKLTVNAHGLTTGQTVNINGLKYNVIYYYSIIQDHCAYPRGNGQYTVTVIDANNFTLNESVAWNLSPLVQTYIVSGATMQAQSLTEWFEYRENNVWGLAKILTVLTTTTAEVYVQQNIKTDIVQQGASVIWSGGFVTSDHSDSFDSTDIGSYIRSSVGTWHLILGIVTDQKALASPALSLFTYSYPTITVLVTTPIQLATLKSSVAVFVNTDIGRLVRLNYGGKQPWCTITAFASTTEVTVSIIGLIPLNAGSISGLYNGGATDVWKLGALSDTTGYPRVAGFHEQRFCLGGSTSEPQTFWMSNSSDYENFAPSEYDSTVLDSNAITYTIVSNKANPITWMISENTLLLGTLGPVFKVGTPTGSPITPTNIAVTPQSNNGSAISIQALKTDSSILFIQRAQRKLIELLYDFNEDRFQGHNLCIVADHIFRRGNKAIAMAYQREPNNIIWCALEDGSLAALTYERDQQVAAWHAHNLGGDGKVESVCATNSADGTEDYLYMVVNRTINGVTKRIIEYLAPDFYPVTVSDRNNMYFLDGGFTYSGAPTTTITGFAHLANAVLSYVADGVYIGEVTISNLGVATIPVAASTIHFGYRYTGTLQLLPLNTNTKDGGTSLGKIQRVSRTFLRLLNSLQFKYGPDTNPATLYTKNLTKDDGETPSLDFFTGDLSVNLSQTYDLKSTPTVVQDLPYPLIVLAVGPDFEVGS